MKWGVFPNRLFVDRHHVSHVAEPGETLPEQGFQGVGVGCVPDFQGGARQVCNLSEGQHRDFHALKVIHVHEIPPFHDFGCFGQDDQAIGPGKGAHTIGFLTI